MHTNIGFDSVDKILHIADVHIRNYKRHKEYRQVFRKLYKEAKQLPISEVSKIEIEYSCAKTTIQKTDLIKINFMASM